MVSANERVSNLKTTWGRRGWGGPRLWTAPHLQVYPLLGDGHKDVNPGGGGSSSPVSPSLLSGSLRPAIPSDYSLG